MSTKHYQQSGKHP